MPLPSAAFPCCRAHDLYGPVEDYAKSILRTPGDEVYWFHCASSFEGHATVRVAKLGTEVMVFRVYRRSTFGRTQRFQRLLSESNWSRLEGAVLAANFWMLDELGGRHGLDGSMWGFAGRRGHEYHYISRWSPKGELWDLGRLFFDLAGLAEVRLH